MDSHIYGASPFSPLVKSPVSERPPPRSTDPPADPPSRSEKEIQKLRSLAHAYEAAGDSSMAHTIKQSIRRYL